MLKIVAGTTKFDKVVNTVLKKFEKTPTNHAFGFIQMLNSQNPKNQVLVAGSNRNVLTNLSGETLSKLHGLSKSQPKQEAAFLKMMKQMNI